MVASMLSAILRFIFIELIGYLLDRLSSSTTSVYQIGEVVSNFLCVSSISPFKLLLNTDVEYPLANLNTVCRVLRENSPYRKSSAL